MIAGLLAIAAGGFLSSAHCIGMCGGFACAVGACATTTPRRVELQLLYSFGRLFTYAFLGTLAGAAGLSISRLSLGAMTLPQCFGMAAGVLMIGLALSMAGLIHLPRGWMSLDLGIITPLFRRWLTPRRATGAFAAGVANGFLPCGLVYSFLALAAASGSAGRGAITMIAFGIGTIPAMMFIGCGGGMLSSVLRGRLVRAGAVVVIAMGSVTIWRSWPSRTAACCGGATEAYVATGR